MKKRLLVATCLPLATLVSAWLSYMPPPPILVHYALRRIMLEKVHSSSPITPAKKSRVHCAGHLQDIRPDAKAHHTYILANVYASSRAGPLQVQMTKYTTK